MSANSLQDPDFGLKELVDLFLLEVVLVPVYWVFEASHVMVVGTLGENGLHVLIKTLFTVMCHMYGPPCSCGQITCLGICVIFLRINENQDIWI